ncbi:unnamed protein product [Symbiodinium sp. CCMP2592]|nr:unnamed protein product [Symbiodinium sp. CCMP2592]
MVPPHASEVGKAMLAVPSAVCHAGEAVRESAMGIASSVAALVFEAPTCMAFGCARQTHDGWPGYCSKSCRERDKTCKAPGCHRPTYDGKPGYCSRACRNGTGGEKSLELEPRPVEFTWPLSVTKTPRRVGLCAFYFPGYETSWDQACGCAFLGNFYPAPVELRIRDKMVRFRNAEAAFQACKFPDKAVELSQCEGWQAFQLRSDYLGHEDAELGGYGSKWKAMYMVLSNKFTHWKLRKALLATGDAFLLEHNDRVGRDEFWSDNADGSGMNGLGFLLMWIRESFTPGTTWKKFLDAHRPKLADADEPKFDTEWRRLVSAASVTVRKSFLTQEVSRTLPRICQPRKMEQAASSLYPETLESFLESASSLRWQPTVERGQHQALPPPRPPCTTPPATCNPEPPQPPPSRIQADEWHPTLDRGQHLCSQGARQPRTVPISMAGAAAFATAATAICYQYASLESAAAANAVSDELCRGPAVAPVGSNIASMDVDEDGNPDDSMPLMERLD